MGTIMVDGAAARHQSDCAEVSARIRHRREVRACGPDECAKIVVFPRSGNCYVEVDGQPIRYFRHNIVAACEHAERAIGRHLQRDEAYALFAGGAL